MTEKLNDYIDFCLATDRPMDPVSTKNDILKGLFKYFVAQTHSIYVGIMKSRLRELKLEDCSTEFGD